MDRINKAESNRKRQNKIFRAGQSIKLEKVYTLFIDFFTVCVILGIEQTNTEKTEKLFQKIFGIESRESMSVNR